jgi:beta-glucosidase
VSHEVHWKIVEDLALAGEDYDAPMITRPFQTLCWTYSVLLMLLAGCGPAPIREFQIPPAASVNAATRPAERIPFWWGVSTSAFQFEEPPDAASVNPPPAASPQPLPQTDWDIFCKSGKGKGPRDDRISSYSNCDRDIRALKALGVTHYRFSVEWARVEPKPGQFDEHAIAHYVEFAKHLRAENITPIVCLWHFSLPDWLCDFKNPATHGWFHPDAVTAWERYVRRMARELSPYVQYMAPQNEPNLYALAVSLGVFPPGKTMNREFYSRLIDREIDLFNRAAAIMREENKDARIISIQDILYWERDPLDLLGIYYDLSQKFNYAHLDGIAANIDYLGFNYYQREIASPLALANQKHRRGPDVSDLGWFIDPQGLEIEIVELSRRYRKPLIITENGIATEDDYKRQIYLFQHLLAIRRTLDAGYDVRGYFHWSLADGFEWSNGYGPRFGLFELSSDKKTLMPRQSARLYHFFIENKFMETDALVNPSPPELASQSGAQEQTGSTNGGSRAARGGASPYLE